MFANFFHPNNLSQRVMRVILSIYVVVTCIITSVQFLTEYAQTQLSISSELKQLEETVQEPLSVSLWQYNQTQVDVLIEGLLKMPIIEGVDVFDQDGAAIISKRTYPSDSIPLSIFSSTSALTWTLNGEKISLGTLVIYSSSEVVFDRVLFGFSLIVLTAGIKLSILLWLSIWAFNRYLAKPLAELVAQVDDVQLSKDLAKRIQLSDIENNELNRLQDHMNMMLSAIEQDRTKIMENEQTKRNWLEKEVSKRTEDLQILNTKLKDLARKDSLTGILNRGSFFETAQHLLALSQRQKSQAGFIVIDLDNFKLINDAHGHFMGDQVLSHFTKLVATFLRKSDLFGRVGGEEFAIFLPDAEIEGAFQLADKIRQAVSDSTLELDGHSINYTISLGVESSNEDDDSVDELYKRADSKLYSAKDKGRNRVER